MISYLLIRYMFEPSENILWIVHYKHNGQWVMLSSQLVGVYSADNS